MSAPPDRRTAAQPGACDGGRTDGRRGASGATIRRDLEVLALHGVLRRVHGGARSLVFSGENPEYGQRELEDHAAKVRIAEAVAAMLQDRDTSGWTAAARPRKSPASCASAR